MIEVKDIGIFEQDRQVTCARFNRDGTLLAAGGMDGTLKRWNMGERFLEPLAAVGGFSGWVTAVQFAPNADRLFVADSWGQLLAFEGDKSVWKRTDAHDGWIRQVAVDDTRLVTVGRDGVIRVWDHAGQLQHERVVGEDLYCVALHPDGGEIFAGDLRGRIHRWQPGTDRSAVIELPDFFLLSRLQDMCGFRQLRVIEQGKILVVAGCIPGGGATPKGLPTVQFYDLENDRVRARFQHGGASDWAVEDLGVRADGTLVGITSGTPGKGSLFVLRPGEEKPLFATSKVINPHALALHPHGQLCAVAATNRGSNGNGRRLQDDGSYPGNSSPIHLYEFIENSV